MLMTTVGFLALQAPDLSPSQRFRVEAFLPHLERSGIRVDYQWLLDAADLRIFYGSYPPWSKARIVAKAIAKRLMSLSRLPRWDAVLVQREALFIGGAWSERLSALGAPLVVDFDDAIWVPTASEANRRFSFLKNVRKFPAIMRAATTVLAGNEYLATYARQYNSNVVVFPTCVDVERYVPATRHAQSGSPMVIGYSGSRTTIAAHLRPALGILEKVKAKYGDRVTFKVVGDESFRHSGLGIVGEQWSSGSEVAALQSMDVGIMPLPDDEWARGKCGLKGLTYMAVGIPAVMSPVGVNTEIVTDGINGFTPRSDDEWVQRLSELVEDPSLRARIGEAGRETVVQRYSTQRWQERLVETLEGAAEGRFKAG